MLRGIDRAAHRQLEGQILDTAGGLLLKREAPLRRVVDSTARTCVRKRPRSDQSMTHGAWRGSAIVHLHGGKRPLHAHARSAKVELGRESAQQQLRHLYASVSAPGVAVSFFEQRHGELLERHVKRMGDILNPRATCGLRLVTTRK